MGRVLTIRGLSFSYDGRRKILDGLDLDLSAGETLAIMGYSGSGKTTLLKIIAGLLYPYQGTVKTHDAKGGIGYIPQNVGLVKNLTAVQNVAHGALGKIGIFPGLFGKFPQEVFVKAYQLLEDLGLAEAADRKAGLLSGGERQRVAVARALMQNPSILLADEFVSDLDVINAYEVMELTTKICRRNNIALVMTMHDTYLVNKFADRVAVLKDGKIMTEMPGNQISIKELSAILGGGPAE